MSEKETNETPETNDVNLDASNELKEETNEATHENDLAAELEKWKKYARKHEDTVKALTPKVKQFEEWQESQKTEAEKAAEKLALLEAEVNNYKSQAIKLKIASEKGIPVDLLDAIKSVDAEELEAFADKLASLTSGNQSQKTLLPDSQQGKPADTTVGQWTQAMVDAATPAEITAAYKKGLLNDWVKSQN